MNDTNVSTLPDGWTRRRLRFDARINPVKSEVTLPDDTEVSFVPMDAVGELGGLRLDQTRELADVYTGYTYFADGDVCVAKITPCFENGKGALAQGLTNGVAFGTTELHVLRPSDTLDARFLFYLTIAHDFRNIGEAEMLGAGGQKRVPEAFIRDWRPPLPHIDVQQRIANFLDEKTAQIDALIGKKRALLERLAEQRQALIARAVTKGLNSDVPMKPSSVGWIGDVPAHWTVTMLSFRYEVQLGRMLNAERSDGESIRPYLRVFDVQWRRINIVDLPLMDFPSDAQRRYRLIPGDLLVNEGGSFVGRSAVWQGELEECYYQKALHRLRPVDSEKDCADYFCFVMEAATKNLVFEGEGNQTTIDHLTAEQFRRYKFAFPPLREQLAISTYLHGHLKESASSVQKIEDSLLKLKQYRSALITSVITGQLPELNG